MHPPPRKRYFCPILLLLFFVPALRVSGQSLSSLPDAPQPSFIASLGQSSQADDTIAHSKWYGVVDPGDSHAPLSNREKMLFWLHEEVSPVGWTSEVITTGYSQLLDSDPKYGSDSAAFGERLGAATIRDASMRFFSDSLMPVLTHEDPRYYRMAHGSIKTRGLFAARQAFVAHRDNGTTGINYSDIVGHLMASALTPAYYPAPSANGRVVALTWVYSLAGDAGGNLFLEFWPDLREAIFHHRRHHSARE
jgi:hypothetical protein